MTVAAIVLAGGSGSRVAAEVNKVYLPVQGRPLLSFSLLAFEASPEVGQLIVVVREADLPEARRIVAGLPLSKLSRLVVGGPSRQDSELAGLSAIAGEIEEGAIELVAIHDAARPFLTLSLIAEVVEAARRHGGAVPSLPVESPLYEVEGPPHAGAVSRARLLPAPTLARVQTPQVFAARSLVRSYRMAAAEGFVGVDTAETVERYSDLVVAAVPGDPRNLKVTFPEDLVAAEDLARRWRQGGWVD